MAQTYEYNQSEAYSLLIVQVIFIVILLAMLFYWHYLHPNSLEVTKEYEKQLLDSASPDASVH